MRHTALAMLAIVLCGCLSGAVIAKVREWLGDDERTCAGWCALDIDVGCGGEAREHSACMTSCVASEEGLCAEESSRLHACEAELTCPDYRRRRAKGGQCETHRAASETCDSQR